MWLGVASLLATLAVFVAAVVISYELLHGDEVTDKPSSLEPVQIVGAEETVFSWARGRCGEEDIPDLPARAFRDDAGRVQLISAHHVNRRFVGRSLDRLTHPCAVTMHSGDDADPARFNDREWLAAPYTLDGRTIYALVHNEYQGNQHAGRCPSGVYLNCWYNAVTLAVSHDGGVSFRDAQPPPRHLVATVPYRYAPDAGAYGIFSPSNIVHNKDDGYYYVLVAARRYRRQQFGSCVLRTQRLGDPSSWRAWGDQLDGSAVSPLEPVQIVGSEETVFSWPRDHCATLDYPDAPARAFRDAQGRTQLIASHYVTRRLIGRRLGRLTHQCAATMRSDRNANCIAHGPPTHDGRARKAS